MFQRAATLLMLTAFAASLLVPSPAAACGNNGGDAQSQAEQAISWASSLVEWHARRRVATAAPEDSMIVALQREAQDELLEARAFWSNGRYEQAITHARNVESLLDN